MIDGVVPGEGLRDSGAANAAAGEDMSGPAHLRRVLFRYAASRVRDPYAAEDLVQDTLLVAVTRTQPTANLQAYLLGVLKNKIADHHSRAARLVPTDDERLHHLAGAADPDDEPGAALQSHAAATLARAALAQLSDRDRDLLTLRMAGASVSETAAALDLSEGTTRVAQSRALRRFTAVYTQLAEG